jgi:hypothetical protein
MFAPTSVRIAMYRVSCRGCWRGVVIAADVVHPAVWIDAERSENGGKHRFLLSSAIMPGGGSE